MKKYYFYPLFFAVFFALVVANMGCSTTKNVVEKVTPGGKPKLKKRVLVFPLVNISGLSNAVAQDISKSLIDRLNNSKHLVIYEVTDEIDWPLEGRLPEPTVAAKEKMFTRAEALGMNAFVTGVINPIDSMTEKKGFWPLRSTKWSFEISITMNVVDVMTRTMLLAKIESEKVFLEYEEDDQPSREDLHGELIEKAIPDIVKRLASEAVDELEEAPWRGKIIDVDGEDIKIYAGENAGIELGHRFEVSDQADTITAKSGEVFRLLGKKVGELEITQVMEKRSIARPVESARFSPGQLITFIP